MIVSGVGVYLSGQVSRCSAETTVFTSTDFTC